MQITWKEVDSEDSEVEETDSKFDKIFSWDFIKAMSLLILGIPISIFLSRPLIEAVSRFSGAIHVPSFFISFVVIPVALSGRVALYAIFTSSRKNSKVASVTFSEVCLSLI